MTFVLDCSSIAAGLSGPLRVNCFGSRDIASVECIYDNGLIVEPCEHVKIQCPNIIICIMGSGEMEPYDYAGHNLTLSIHLSISVPSSDLNGCSNSGLFPYLSWTQRYYT